MVDPYLYLAPVSMARIEDDRLAEAVAGRVCLEATREVLARHGGVWFNDQSFLDQSFVDQSFVVRRGRA